MKTRTGLSDDEPFSDFSCSIKVLRIYEASESIGTNGLSPDFMESA